MKIWRKRIADSINQSVNQLISDEAVYRTAPATPGLLNSLEAQNPRRDTRISRVILQV